MDSPTNEAMVDEFSDEVAEPESAEVQVPALDDNVLSMLGEAAATTQSFSAPIHQDISIRWNNILINGLTLDKRSELLQKYSPIENCPLIAAPKVNPELAVSFSETALQRDTRLAKIQDQIGSSLTAIGLLLQTFIDDKVGGGESKLHAIQL